MVAGIVSMVFIVGAVGAITARRVLASTAAVPAPSYRTDIDGSAGERGDCAASCDGSVAGSAFQAATYVLEAQSSAIRATSISRPNSVYDGLEQQQQQQQQHQQPVPAVSVRV